MRHPVCVKGALDLIYVHYFMFSFLQVCRTKDGPYGHKPCIFPFIYGGKSYGECTTEDHDQPWCSTKVDAGGIHVGGYWGNCNGYCDVGKGLSILKGISKGL